MQGMKMRIVPPQVEEVLKTALGIKSEDWRSKTVTVLDTEVSPVALLELANPAHLKAFEHKAVQVGAGLQSTVRNNPCRPPDAHCLQSPEQLLQHKNQHATISYIRTAKCRCLCQAVFAPFALLHATFAPERSLNSWTSVQCMLARISPSKQKHWDR